MPPKDLPLSTLRALWDFLDDPGALERLEITMNDPIARDMRAEMSSQDARKITFEGGPTYRDLAKTLAKVWTTLVVQGEQSEEVDAVRKHIERGLTPDEGETLRFVEARTL